MNTITISDFEKWKSTKILLITSTSEKLTLAKDWTFLSGRRNSESLDSIKLLDCKLVEFIKSTKEFSKFFRMPTLPVCPRVVVIPSQARIILDKFCNLQQF